jgi:hypothetical protein
MLPALAAQGFVSPEHFKITEANKYAYTPFGDTTAPARFLQIHDDLLSPMTINKIALRRDGFQENQYPAYVLLLDMWMSNAAKMASDVDRTFDLNHGANKVLVRDKYTQLSMPATMAGPIPRPFEYSIPLTQPFVWNASGSLAWEIVLSSTTLNAPVNFDYVHLINPNPPPEVYSFGNGCKASNYSTATQLVPTSSANWGEGIVNFHYAGSHLPKNAMISLNLGYSWKDWGGLTLPYELPGTGTAPSGPCTIYNEGLVILPALTTATGTFQYTVQLNGMHHEYNGLSVFTQAVALDQAANAWGVVTSNSVQHHIVAAWNMTAVGYAYLQGGNGPIGTAVPNAGFVVKFD